jgi:hypothetical protein
MRMELDKQGWSELSSAAAEFLTRAQAIEVAAKERIGDDPHPEGVSAAGLVILLFDALRLTDQPPPIDGAAARSHRSASERAVPA